MSTSDRPLDGTDYVFEETPWWAVGPLKSVLGDLTYNEAHAMELGLTGIVMGAMWAVGYVKEAVVLSFILVGIAFGLRRLPESKPIAARVIRREPWYFTTVYLVMWILSAGVIEVTLG